MDLLPEDGEQQNMWMSQIEYTSKCRDPNRETPAYRICDEIDGIVERERSKRKAELQIERETTSLPTSASSSPAASPTTTSANPTDHSRNKYWQHCGGGGQTYF